jgi:hypothetical protein
MTPCASNLQIEAPRDLLGRVMNVFNMDQGMRSLGSLVMGAFARSSAFALGSPSRQDYP